MYIFLEITTSSIKPIVIAIAKRVNPKVDGESWLLAKRTINYANSTTLRFRTIDDPLDPIDTNILAMTAAGRLELKIRKNREFGDPDYYFNGLHIYGTLPPGFVISYDTQKSTIKLYAPNLHEAHYAKKDYGSESSLLEQATRGKLLTNQAAHKNMYGAAHYLAHLAKFDPKREDDIHAALTYLNNGTAPLSAVHRGLSIIKIDSASHIHLIKPVIRNLTGLTKRAQRMLDGDSGVAPSAIGSKPPPLIQLPSAQPNLFTIAIMAPPEHSSSLFNFVSFFYDMSSTNGMHSGNRWYFNLSKTYFDRVDNALGLRKRTRLSQAPESNDQTNATSTEIGADSVGTFIRFDGGAFIGANFLSPVGGVWGQFRVFFSYNPASPQYGRFHLRLLNYAGFAIPSGVVDVGLFEFTEYSFKYNMQTGRADDWMHTIGIYAYAEIAFPLSGQGEEPVIGRSYREILSDANQNRVIASANWIGDKLSTVFKWLKVNISSGTRQAISQIRRLGTQMDADSDKMSDTFGPVDGQIGFYVGVSLTSNFSKKTEMQKITQLAAEFGGALTGGAAGFALSYLTGLISSVSSAAAVTDSGGELGAFIGSLAYSAAAKDGASLDLDWGALTWIGARAPAGPGSFGVFNQNNVFWSTNITTFN